MLDAYCPHLGANMGEGGRVVDDCLECPFHNWRFRGDGECHTISYTDKGKLNKLKKKKNMILLHFYFVQLF